MKPRLLDVRVPRDPRGVVVVMHGGASRPGRPGVSPTQLSVLRMIPVARRIARADRHLAVLRLLNSYRGWDTEHTPLDDATWALEQACDRFGDLPVAFVGHSLGGRAALLAAADERVDVVVALNPWVYPDDGVPLPGRRVLFVHGDEDRIAQPARARAVARRLAGGRRAADVEFVDVPGGKHAMLRHGRRFETTAARFVAEHLGTVQPESPEPGRTP